MKKILLILLFTSFNLFASQPPVREAFKKSLARTRSILKEEEKEKEPRTVKLAKKITENEQVVTSTKQIPPILIDEKESESEKAQYSQLERNNKKIHDYIKYRHELRKGLESINASGKTFPPFNNTIEQKIFLLDSIERATGIIAFYIQQNKSLRKQLEKE